MEPLSSGGMGPETALFFGAGLLAVWICPWLVATTLVLAVGRRWLGGGQTLRVAAATLLGAAGSAVVGLGGVNFLGLALGAAGWLLLFFLLQIRPVWVFAFLGWTGFVTHSLALWGVLHWVNFAYSQSLLPVVLIDAGLAAFLLKAGRRRKEGTVGDAGNGTDT